MRALCGTHEPPGQTRTSGCACHRLSSIVPRRHTHTHTRDCNAAASTTLAAGSILSPAPVAAIFTPDAQLTLGRNATAQRHLETATELAAEHHSLVTFEASAMSCRCANAATRLALKLWPVEQPLCIPHAPLPTDAPASAVLRLSLPRPVSLPCHCQPHSPPHWPPASPTPPRRPSRRLDHAHASRCCRQQPASCAAMYRRTWLVISRGQGLRLDPGFAVPALMS